MKIKEGNYIKSEDLLEMIDKRSVSLSLMFTDPKLINQEFVSGTIAGFEEVKKMIHKLEKED